MQASLKKHVELYWLPITDTVSRVDNFTFRVQNIDLTNLLKAGRKIQYGTEICHVRTSSFTSSNTDVKVDRKVVTSAKTVSTLLPVDWTNDIITIVDDEYCFAGKFYKRGSEYKLCIKNTDDLDDKKWKDTANFSSIEAPDAKGIRDLGFAQLSLAYDAGNKKLTLEETTK